MIVEVQKVVVEAGGAQFNEQFVERWAQLALWAAVGRAAAAQPGPQPDSNGAPHEKRRCHENQDSRAHGGHGGKGGQRHCKGQNGQGTRPQWQDKCGKVISKLAGPQMKMEQLRAMLRQNVVQEMMMCPAVIAMMKWMTIS